MTRRLLILLTLVATVAFVLPASASLAGPVLQAKVGPGYDISLQDGAGHTVTELPPGDYTIKVSDGSATHNFHLAGPGTDVSTTVSGVGSTTWNITLAGGSYQFYCDSHYDTMLGSFAVAADSPPSSSPPPSPPPPPAPAPPPSPAPSPAAPPAPAPAPPPVAATTLVGTVGPGFTISLTDAAGSRVGNLDPGSYTIQLHDRGTFHNFHLFGPGVEQSTDVDSTGDVTWNVTFAVGIYTFQCDVHPDTMRGTFRVGNPPPPPPPSPPPASPPPPPPPPAGSAKLPRLSGSVGPGYTIALNGAHRKLKTTKARSYLLTVHDRSAIHDFHLVGPGVSKKTGVGFRGTVSWKVKLRKRATYRYWCDPHKSIMKGSFQTT